MGVRTSGMSNDDVIVQAAEAHAKDRATCRTLVSLLNNGREREGGVGRSLTPVEGMMQGLNLHAPFFTNGFPPQAGVECRVQRVALISGDKNVLLKARSRAVPSCSGDAFMAWLIEGLERITTAAEGDEA